MTTSKVIISDKQIMGGAPCFRSTRIPVEIVFDHLKLGMSPQDIVAEWPGLDPADLKIAIEEARDFLIANARKTGT
jgi:uncharacterized protein (DUF433 family)